MNVDKYFLKEGRQDGKERREEGEEGRKRNANHVYACPFTDRQNYKALCSSSELNLFSLSNYLCPLDSVNNMPELGVTQVL